MAGTAHSAVSFLLGVPIGAAFLAAGYALFRDRGGLTSGLARFNARVLSRPGGRERMEARQRNTGRAVGAVWMLVGVVFVIGGLAGFFSRVT